MLNKKYYKGSDLYSDGDVENDILKIVREGKDPEKAIAEDSRWPILYHLTSTRENLLEWIPFEKNASLLEIGAGCVALTGLLCEKLGKVTAVELSARRAEITNERLKDKKNLEIYAGNLSDIEFGEKFDYITLIGVLEYAGKYKNSKNPYMDFLKDVKKLLKDDGTLIIAIENKFGMKYFSGAREDHTGAAFDGIQGYTRSDVRTFGKNELISLLKSSGYGESHFYYPMPDYKLPGVIFSDFRPPKIGEIGRTFSNFDRDKVSVFSECLGFENAVNSGEFGFFANSFLVFCGKKPAIDFVKYNNLRMPAFQAATEIMSGGAASTKRSLRGDGEKHISRIVQNFSKLGENHGDFKIAGCRFEAGKAVFEYIEGRSLDELLYENAVKRDKNGFFGLLAEFKKNFDSLDRSKISNFKADVGFTEIFGDTAIDFDFDSFKVSDIDIIFDNIIVKDGAQVLIDYEWVFETVLPVNYILFRSIFTFWNKYVEHLDGFVTPEEIFNFFGIAFKEIPFYGQMERKFQAFVHDQPRLSNLAGFQKRRDEIKIYDMVKHSGYLETRVKALNMEMEKTRKLICEKEDIIEKLRVELDGMKKQPEKTA